MERRRVTLVGKTKRGKGSKIMAIADRYGRPVAVHVESATPHEVTLVNVTLAETLVRKRPERLMGITPTSPTSSMGSWQSVESS